MAHKKYVCSIVWDVDDDDSDVLELLPDTDVVYKSELMARFGRGTYSLDYRRNPAELGDALVEFLTEKHGFCIQKLDYEVESC